MDPFAWTVESDLEERTHGFERSTKVGELPQTAKGRRRFLSTDWVNEIAPHVRFIIPQGGIVGSNPAPATNFRP